MARDRGDRRRPVMLYTIAIAIHVVVAVVAIGLVGAIPITARFARRAPAQLVGVDTVLAMLVRAVQLGLVAMLLSGVLLDVSVDGAYHATGWFRGSALLFIAVAFSVARARSALRRGDLAGVERWGWIASALVALVTLLMRTKLVP
jgi:hypothetical protein